ncbi:hypothetical protein SynA1528_00143 [Synechococcus sp. A15-28]|nr:hypothetical protein SynA1528_00143 [Synechococcus sp. A15-28]
MRCARCATADQAEAIARVALPLQIDFTKVSDNEENICFDDCIFN